jgi:hypothetical protein
MSSHSRFLCPSDFSASNFRKRTTQDGRLVVVALDFRATCFMPLPFIEVALKKPRDRFCQSVVKKITYPHQQLIDAKVLLSASGSLVQYGSKPVGKQDFSIFVLILRMVFIAVQHSHSASVLG